MKKLFLFAGAIVLSIGVFAQQAKKAEDVVKFKELTYDFGKIKQNAPVSHDFVFTNISNKPVIIESAIPGCGCTTPSKPEGAIPQGKEDKITAAFNAAAQGPFNKNITIKLAGIDLPVVLHITGEVLTAEAYAKYEAAKSKSGK
ncbi:MAG TPA: DUF1573 domain-containing protein [Puia sp.]|uniref:DUF1573 domain-containing protein n=1 Tax=Puia sp. TaxID=2045100 RepID=UPI002D02AB4D|nr:DUF1573 domain-containing protein [Puia sp.]HVU93865.1 DUF1573 domain-containing protein [Puia sp.]